MKKTSFLLLLATLGLLWVSCKPEPKPVTPEEAEEIAKTITAAAANKNPEYLNRLLSIEALCDKVQKVSGVKLSTAERNAFDKGFRKRQIGHEILDGLERDGLKLLHRYARNGKQHLLLRAYYKNGGINYFDFTLIRQDEKIKVEDLLVYTAGEPVSVITSRTFNDLQKSKYAQDEIDALTRMRHLITEQAYHEAYEVYQALAPKVRKQKVFMLLKVEIVTGMDDDEELRVQTLEEYKSLFPKEVNIPLLMIDAYFLKGDYEKALASVNQLNQLVQNDPFLDYYRSLCYKQMNNFGQYTLALERLHKYDPDFQDGLLELIAAYLKQRESEKAKEIIKAYREHAGFDQKLLDNYLKTAEGVSKDMLAIKGMWQRSS